MCHGFVVASMSACVMLRAACFAAMPSVSEEQMAKQQPGRHTTMSLVRMLMWLRLCGSLVVPVRLVTIGISTNGFG